MCASSNFKKKGAGVGRRKMSNANKSQTRPKTVAQLLKRRSSTASSTDGNGDDLPLRTWTILVGVAALIAELVGLVVLRAQLGFTGVTLLYLWTVHLVQNVLIVYSILDSWRSPLDYYLRVQVHFGVVQDLILLVLFPSVTMWIVVPVSYVLVLIFAYSVKGASPRPRRRIASGAVVTFFSLGLAWTAVLLGADLWLWLFPLSLVNLIGLVRVSAHPEPLSLVSFVSLFAAFSLLAFVVVSAGITLARQLVNGFSDATLAVLRDLQLEAVLVLLRWAVIFVHWTAAVLVASALVVQLFQHVPEIVTAFRERSQLPKKMK